MTTIPKLLNEFDTYEEADRERGLNLVKRMCGNLTKDPQNPKFRDVNFSKIRKAFKGCPAGLHFLFAAGWKQSFDGSRLQFDTNNWKMLTTALEMLDKKENPPPEPEPEPEPVPSAVAEIQAMRNNTAAAADAEQPAAADNSMDVDAENTNNDDDNNNNNNSNDADDMTVDSNENNESKFNLDEAIDDVDELMQMIKANKSNHTTLNMAELQGLTKEEKLELLKKKKDQYRADKKRNAVQANINREKSRRENIRAQQEADRKREAYRLKMMAEKKKREKEEAKRRKKAIREKIKLDKARRKREKAAREQAAQNNSQNDTQN